MPNVTQTKKQFVALEHTQKLKKVREALYILSKKSSFFADLRNRFKQQDDIQEHALDAMYSVVMNLVFNAQKK